MIGMCDLGNISKNTKKLQNTKVCASTNRADSISPPLNMTDATEQAAAVPLHDALPQHALPVIDISPFITNPEADGEEAKKKVARAVHDACVESGFFLISNYQGVLPQDKVDGLLQLMRRFFSLSPAYKRQLKGTYGRGTPPLPLHHALVVPASAGGGTSATERRALASLPRCAARTLLRSCGERDRGLLACVL
jgi:hypothetical protein